LAVFLENPEWNSYKLNEQQPNASLFLLAIVLSVLLGIFTDSDYPFGIIQLFLEPYVTKKNIFP
jgi:hypothetical protein